MRTTHIAVTSVLAGGYFFGLESGRLHPWLAWAFISGLALMIAEAYPDWRWCCEARAWLVFVKILLTGLMIKQSEYRLPWLLVILIIGSVGSHMPRKLRHYSVASSHSGDGAE